MNTWKQPDGLLSCSFFACCPTHVSCAAYLIAETNGQELQMELLKQNGAQKGVAEKEVSKQWALSITDRLHCIDTVLVYLHMCTYVCDCVYTHTYICTDMCMLSCGFTFSQVVINFSLYCVCAVTLAMGTSRLVFIVLHVCIRK